MYSYEERMRAVELYIRLGKRLGATIRELGYPAKNALKGWHREYERRQDLRIRSAPRPLNSTRHKNRLRWSIMRARGTVFHGRCVPWAILTHPGTVYLRSKGAAA